MIFNVSFGDQLRPFESRLTGVQRLAGLGNIGVIIRKPAVNILCRSENEYRVLSHLV